MDVALAAGALVLSTVAVVVAAASVRARREASAGRAVAAPPVPVDRTDDGGVASAGTARAARRLHVADAAARSRSEADLRSVVVRAVAEVAPRSSVEVRLDPVDPQAAPAEACPVPDTASCPAVRQATVVSCADSTGLDACPWLAVRPGVPVAATCAPVAVAGRGVGFVHVVEPCAGTLGVVGAVAPEVVDEVAWLAAHVGARLEGWDRTPATSGVPSGATPVGSSDVGSDPPVVVDLTDRSAAPIAGVEPGVAGVEPGVAGVEPGVAGPPEPVGPATDDARRPGAAGWSDPSTFVAELAAALAAERPFVLVVAGVDDHGALVAARGRPVGEAAVAALAVGLVANPDPLGPADLLACSRLDESTIVVAWTGLTLGRSVELIEVVRSELLDAELSGQSPACRRSFGLTHSSISTDPGALVAAARSGLDRARALGGDQIVYADLSLLEEPPAAG